MVVDLVVRCDGGLRCKMVLMVAKQIYDLHGRSIVLCGGCIVVTMAVDDGGRDNGCSGDDKMLMVVIC